MQLLKLLIAIWAGKSIATNEEFRSLQGLCLHLCLARHRWRRNRCEEYYLGVHNHCNGIINVKGCVARDGKELA